jgi:HD domain
MSDLVARSMSLANLLHAGDVRKGMPFPYISHSVDVVKQLRRWGVTDEVTLSAAVLHDVREEVTTYTAASLVTSVGATVAGIVEELTFTGETTKAAYLKSFANKSPEALIVKAADRCCNVRDFALEDRVYARKYLKQADCLYDVLYNRVFEIGDRFGSGILNGFKSGAGQLALDTFNQLQLETRPCLVSRNPGSNPWGCDTKGCCSQPFAAATTCPRITCPRITYPRITCPRTTPRSC